MGKRKISKDSLEKKRARDRRRRAMIKNDPETYRECRKKEQARYRRRKQEKKVLPISELPPQKQEIVRKKNREAFRAYYKRLKAKRLKAIDAEESKQGIILAQQVKLEEIYPLTSTPESNTSRLVRSGHHNTSSLTVSADSQSSANVLDNSHNDTRRRSLSPLLVPYSSTLPTLITPISAVKLDIKEEVNMEGYSDDGFSEKEINVHAMASTATTCAGSSGSREHIKPQPEQAESEESSEADEVEEYDLEYDNVIREEIIIKEEPMIETTVRTKKFKRENSASPRKPKLSTTVKKRLVKEISDKLDCKLLEVVRLLRRDHSKKKDECDSFGEYIADSLRKHDDKTQCMIKQAINNILFEQEMKKFKSTSTLTLVLNGLDENPLKLMDDSDNVK